MEPHTAFRTWLDAGSPLAEAYEKAWSAVVKDNDVKYNVSALPLEELEKALRLDPGSLGKQVEKDNGPHIDTVQAKHNPFLWTMASLPFNPQTKLQRVLRHTLAAAIAFHFRSAITGLSTQRGGNRNWKDHRKDRRRVKHQQIVEQDHHRLEQLSLHQ